MRSDVHSAALRAAAKVAFSVAFISGCSAPTADGEDVSPANNTDGVEPGSTESDITSKPKPKKHGTRAEQLATGCHADKDASVPPKLTT